jgi:hypothetical protein
MQQTQHSDEPVVVDWFRGQQLRERPRRPMRLTGPSMDAPSRSTLASASR